jgi:hypothetical protein
MPSRGGRPARGFLAFRRKPKALAEELSMYAKLFKVLAGALSGSDIRAQRLPVHRTQQKRLAPEPSQGA